MPCRRGKGRGTRPEGPLAGRGGRDLRCCAALVRDGVSALLDGQGGLMRVHVGLVRWQVVDEGVQRRQGAALHVVRQQMPLAHRRAVQGRRQPPQLRDADAHGAVPHDRRTHHRRTGGALVRLRDRNAARGEFGGGPQW